MPAIWILPLSLYLLSFIIVFADPPRWVIPVSTVCYTVLAIVVSVWGRHATHGEVAGVLLHNAMLFCGAIVLHGQLAATRPNARHLTEFSLWISCGGLFGSILNTLIAPLLFDWLAEYPLAIGLGLCLMPWPGREVRTMRLSFLILRTAMFSGVFIAMAWNIYFSETSHDVIFRERTFYGEFHVASMRRGIAHRLMHGSTMHGMQVIHEDVRLRRPPLTYYFNTGPIGQLIRAYRGTPVVQSVGVVGLGIGSLAAYAENGDEYTFYEIDPAIGHLAADTRYFTFLHDAPQRGAKVHVVLGDARLRLRDAADRSFGLLVLDAFSSDAIPVHLLTKEAVVEYHSKLRSDGLLAFHISNNYLDLEPVLANLAADLGYECLVQNDDRLSKPEQQLGKFASNWLVMGTTAENLRPLQDSGRWRPGKTRPQVPVWTDDQSNVLSIIRWK
ncbi:MAG: fused MFS/spermidine synthase [Planctomycetia bacterium]|nr:fused MFS/spermidine synthase [Planctomycetia bacterium]